MKRNNPLVSIIIPTYNHAKFLDKCLLSIKKQTYQNWETIIVNNYSTDNTAEIVSRYEDPRFRLINFKNSGIIAASRNKGIRNSTGEFIAFLDSDDWWYPKKLEYSIRSINQQDFTYHDLDIYTANGKRFLKKVGCRQIKKPIFANLLKKGIGPTNSSVVVRKKIIDQVGGLSEDPKLVAAEDYDLWLEISKVTEKFRYIPKTLGAYWFGGGNTSEVSEKQIARIKALYQKHMPLLDGNDKNETEFTLCYSLGRIYLALGQNKRANEMFRIAKKTKNLEIKFKTLYSMLLMNLGSKNYSQ
jgi:glycosyltransferase involved in cell wall biosynthesis